MKIYVPGSRRITNFIWSATITLGGLGFYLAGLASFFKTSLMQVLFWVNVSGISYIPQGIVLMFYGSAGVSLGIFLFLTCWWGVGSGYNEYGTDQILICRQGYPGKNRLVTLSIPFEDLELIKIRSTNGNQQLFICLKDGRVVPLTGNQQFLTFSKIKEDAISLSQHIWDTASLYVPFEVEVSEFEI